MRHRIIKLTDDGEKSVGDFIVNFDNSFSIDSEDVFLINWLKELRDEEITMFEGIRGTNEADHEVYAEIGKAVKPGDVDFISALNKYLPEDYFFSELLEEEKILERKTA